MECKMLFEKKLKNNIKRISYNLLKKLKHQLRCFLLFKKLNCFNDQFEACAVSAFMKKYYNDIVEEL